VARPRRTNGREGVTRDTPLGVCHVTSRCPATPTVTYRDSVTSDHAVTIGARGIKRERCRPSLGPTGGPHAGRGSTHGVAHRPQGRTP
jgi:hypothetical protein